MSCFKQSKILKKHTKTVFCQVLQPRCACRAYWFCRRQDQASYYAFNESQMQWHLLLDNQSSWRLGTDHTYVEDTAGAVRNDGDLADCKLYWFFTWQPLHRTRNGRLVTYHNLSIVCNRVWPFCRYRQLWAGFPAQVGWPHMCLVILGIKFLTDLICIVLTMLWVGPGAALALVGHLYLYNRKTYRKIMFKPS